MICSRRKTTPGRQQGEQIELLAGELDRRTVHADPARRQFDPDRAEPERALAARGGLLVGGAPADGVDAGEQFSGVVRLDHVVVGSEVQAVDAGAHVGAGGDHDHRGAGALADLAADLVTVLVGQAQVEQDDAEAAAAGDEGLEGLLAAARVGDLEAVPGEHGGQGRGDVVVVLDEQKSHPGPLRFTVRTFRCVYVNTCTRACAPCAVTPMETDGVKGFRLRTARSYPDDMRPGDKCYDTCPIAIGS
jgi:hypothetical protein